MSFSQSGPPIDAMAVTAGHVATSTAAGVYAQVQSVGPAWTPIVCALIGLAGVIFQMIYQTSRERIKAKSLLDQMELAVHVEVERRMAEYMAKQIEVRSTPSATNPPLNGEDSK